MTAAVVVVVFISSVVVDVDAACADTFFPPVPEVALLPGEDAFFIS